MKDFDRAMGAPPPEAFLVVSNEKQARLLSNAESFAFFTPFIARERSVSEAAAELNLDADRMLYRVRVFHQAGLLRITRRERRAGRPIKYYRSVADAFFIPFSMTPYADIEEQVLAQLQETTERIVKGVSRVLKAYDIYGRRIFRAKDGTVWRDASAGLEKHVDLEDAALPIGEMTSDDLMLTEAEARALQRELRDVWQRYSQRRHETGKRSAFLLSFAIVSVDAD